MEKLVNFAYILAIVGLSSGASIGTHENVGKRLAYLRILSFPSFCSKFIHCKCQFKCIKVH